MNCLEEYKSKLRTAKEAVQAVRSGDWIDYGSNNSFPVMLDAALAEEKSRLHDVKVRGNLIPGPIRIIEQDPEMEHFVYNTWHCGGYERRMCDEGRAFFIPMIFRNLDWYYRNFLTVDVAMLCVSPMDEEGYFSPGGACGAACLQAKLAKTVILEVNEAMPKINGGPDVKIHVSEADYIVEAGRRELWEMKMPEPGETDVRIAELIFPYIQNGATVQLGIGGMPNALGKLIASSELKDIGMHTELCSDGYLDMFKAGKLTNRKKSILPGKSVMGLCLGSRELYDWVDGNPDIVGKPISYVNDPAVISQIENMISINGCIAADLYGQVSSESAGTRQISGTGGQLDFVTGASSSKGGKSFLCMPSSRVDKNGVRHSNILPRFSGDIITTPRSQAEYIVTEFGVVNLAGKSTWERAEMMISIAHPDFREELVRCAEQQHIWRNHHKK